MVFRPAFAANVAKAGRHLSTHFYQKRPNMKLFHRSRATGNNNKNRNSPAAIIRSNEHLEELESFNFNRWFASHTHVKSKQHDVPKRDASDNQPRFKK